MLGLIGKIKMAHLFMKLVNDPSRTDLIFKGIELASDEKDPAVQRLVGDVLSRSEFRVMYESRYMPAPPKMDDLAKCKEGSFGRAVYDHMKSNNLDFNLFPKLKSDRAVDYISARVYQDHDLWHVLLGLSSSVSDELALQGFGVAQYRSPFGAMLIAGGILHLLREDPLAAVQAIGKINDGYNLGSKAAFLLSIKLHEMFDLSLEEVRTSCGLRKLH